MRIRLQILLTVAPIFLGLGLVAGVLKYTSRLSDVELGTEEELFTLAVAVSEFLGDTGGRSFVENGAPESDPVATALRRVADANPIAYLGLLASEAGGGEFSLGELPASREDDEPVVRGWRDGVLISPVIERRDDPWTARAIAAVADEAGPFAVLTVDVDAGDVRALRREILIESLLLAGGILACGILVSWLLGGVVTTAIRNLGVATRVVASGRYRWEAKGGRLREVNDLNNTFDTMTTLLAEILSKTKRAVIEGEQFRKPVHLAETFSRRLWRAEEVSVGNTAVSMIRLGRRPEGDFLAVRRDEGSVRVVMGGVSDFDCEELEAVARASAACALVREELAGDPWKHGFSLAGEVFPFRFWCSLLLRADSTEVEVWSCRAGGRPRREALRIQPDRPWALHGLGGEADDRFDLYLKVLRGLEPGRLLKELAVVLGESVEGGVLIVGNREPSAER